MTSISTKPTHLSQQDFVALKAVRDKIEILRSEKQIPEELMTDLDKENLEHYGPNEWLKVLEASERSFIFTQ